MNLSVHLTPVGDTALVVTVAGELDRYTAPLLSSVLIPQPGPFPRHVVVAAARLWFCDVSGLRVFTAAHRALSATGGGLAIAGASATLRRLTALIALDAENTGGGEISEVGKGDRDGRGGGNIDRGPVHYANVTEALRVCAGLGDEALPGPTPRHLPSFRGLGDTRTSFAGARTRRPTRPRP